MHAYIDESGNTGKNPLDLDQPHFLSMAMCSHVDFGKVFRERVKSIARSVGLDYLHAIELGVGRLEDVARDLIELIEFSQVKFCSVYASKCNVAVSKFYDTVVDPGENPAAPAPHYAIRPPRFGLLLLQTP